MSAGAACGACGAREGTPLFDAVPLDASEPRFVIFGCPACGVARTEPQPPTERLRALYDADYDGGESAKLVAPAEALRRLLARRRARRFAASLPPGARALDVGCGDGRLVAALGAAGLRAVGLEGSAAPARRAARLVPGRIVVADPAQLPFRDAVFDAVVVWHVLEHLSAPAAALAAAARSTRPGGRVVIAVPDLDGLAARLGRGAWFGLDVPRHLHHFGGRSLGALVGRTGLVVRRRRHWNLELAPVCVLETVLRTVGLERLGLYRHLRAGAPAGRGTRLAATAAAALLLPPAFLFSLVAAALGRGSDVQLWAERPADRAGAASR